MLTLKSLLAPTSVDEFLASYWGQRAFHQPCSDAIVDALKSILGGFDTPSLLRLGTSISVMGYIDGATDRKDNVRPQQALLYYERGYTLYFNLHNNIPECRALIGNILGEAGVRAVASYCSIFASKNGGGLQPHFDNNGNFTVQLAGRKVWTFWNEPRVENPLHSLRHGERLLNPESGMYLLADMQSAALEGEQVVVMSPGDVLYHPPGLWHATRADAESVSLNVCIQPMTYFDVLIGAVAARMMAQKEVRRELPSARGDAGKAEFRTHMAAAVAAAKAALESMDSADAADAVEAPLKLEADIEALALRACEQITPETRLRLSSLAAFEVNHDNAGGLIVVHFFLGRLSNRVSIRTPESLISVCRRICAARNIFTPRSLASECASEEQVAYVCRALSAIRAISPV